MVRAEAEAEAEAEDVPAAAAVVIKAEAEAEAEAEAQSLTIPETSFHRVLKMMIFRFDARSGLVMKGLSNAGAFSVLSVLGSLNNSCCHRGI